MTHEEEEADTDVLKGASVLFCREAIDQRNVREEGESNRRLDEWSILELDERLGCCLLLRGTSFWKASKEEKEEEEEKEKKNASNDQRVWIPERNGHFGNRFALVDGR